LKRLLALYPDRTFPTPAELLATNPAQQLACGFSSTKLATIRRIAEATQDGIVPDLEVAKGMTNEALIERLASLKGIGRWTVEMLLIYSLSRMDVLPGDDFGVREGYRRLKALERAPTPREVREIGQRWTPFRTVATWYLWRARAPGPADAIPVYEN
jgi:DNA-3-methyladenine glycosylase II